ncbi:CocE/NonD family hydrolase [Lutimaribacter marinistellae]|uniref:CocE/NonD family hydrolase n=1 Tax=Lutimaribacter marinistellae TaxID=1820329 RepID=A0ABV7TID7_9RHOB
MPQIAIRTEFPRKTREIENVWIPMPDGTRLAARIWLPEDAEENPVPAILEYLPYRKRDGTVERDALTHPYFAGHGYAGVRVDMRGTGDSEGICLGEYLLQEQDDALTVIEWLAAQHWCSGKVGMIGISWGGFNGLQIAARQPEALGAVITLCSTDDRYADDIHFMGGAVLTDKLAWGATAFAIANTPPDPAIVGERWRDMWIDRLENNGLWMVDWFRHQRRDEFWRHGSICEDYDAVKVPVYAVGGYADGYTNPIFRMMQNLTCPRKALVGPWAHKYPHFATPAPRIGFLQECLRWWDQHLKGLDTGIMDEPMVRTWIQEPAAPSTVATERPGRWVSAPNWPTPGSRVSSWHVNPAGLSQEAAPANPITLACPETAGMAAQTWCIYGVDADGPMDQNLESGRMRFFDTPPLEQDMQIMGFPILHTSVASDADQANLAAVLSMVAPDGKATLISFGVLNLTHRDGHAEPKPLPIGQSVPAQLQLNVIGQRVPAGYRLRLQLSQSYWPLIWPSPRRVQLTLTETRLDLPLLAEEAGPDLPAFARPEGAAPLQTEEIEAGHSSRTHCIDCTTGAETHTRSSDTGRLRHVHTGIEVHYENEDSFTIHPDHPNSASGTCRWAKHYRRGDWIAELDTSVTVRALPDAWHITATLEARDADGIVVTREWDETIQRDLV